MAEPLHLPPDEEPQVEQIRLGDQTLELDPESAATVRNAFESLAAQYGAALEEYRRQTLQSFGTPQAPPPFPTGAPQLESGLAVPDPDLLFQNKQAWTDDFARSLEGRLGQLEGRQTQLVQGAVSAFQQELARRDAATAAQQRHDAAMAEMLERRGLSEHTRVVQAVYNELYPQLQHLPLELGLDKIGAEAQREIERIRAGEQWQLTGAQTQTGVAPRPPQMLRSARRAQRAPAAAPAASEEMTSPGGGLGAMGMIIRKHQATRMRTETA
jgi:hypothetical protein